MSNKTIEELVEDLRSYTKYDDLEIYPIVQTPDGERTLIRWRRKLPDGDLSTMRVVLSTSIDLALLKAISFEDDIEDMLYPGRAEQREAELRES